MRNYLLQLLAHEQWANARLFAALSALPRIPARTAQLYPHLMGAHEFWYRKVNGADINWWEWDFFKPYTLAECMELNEAYAAKWQSYIRELPEPLDAQTLPVTLKTGQRVEVRIVDILTQFHGHSIHHRGQISADLRAAGFEPVPQDWLRFCWEQG
jgi:uncharacterized damage-inducible protein DinB